MTFQDDHQFVQEQLAAAIAGGLAPAEQTRFEAHVAACAACAATLDEWRKSDELWRQTLAADVPGDAFEDRLAAHFRENTMKRSWVHPLVKRMGVGMAATLALGTSGVLAQYVVAHDLLQNPLTEHVMAQVDVTQLPVSPLRLARMDRKMETPGAGETSEPAPNANRGESHKQNELNQQMKKIAGHKFVDMPVPYDDDVLADSEEWKKLQNAGGSPRSVSSLQEGGRETSRQQEQKTDQLANLPNVVVGTPLLGPSRGSEAQVSLGYYAVNDMFGLQSESNPQGIAHAGALQLQGGQKEAQGNADGKDAVAPGKALGKQDLDLAAGRLLTQAAAQPASPGGWGSAVPATSPANAAAQEMAASRKMIRTGTVEYEVASFDDASATIETVVAEEAGFVSSTDSQRGANGKISGSVTLRVPPEHLDRVVLKLRGIGELKRQQIASSDITRQYTDLQSELRALRAMEERLLNLIKTGKGEVKDLVEAEKQLGEYRVKIETIEGQIRYFNNQVALSTLTVNLIERDIRRPAALVETGQVNVAIETEEVETQYAQARKLIADAKGRILQSDLKHLEAGQVAATILCEAPPDQADALANQLKLLGNTVRMQRQRRTTAEEGSATAPAAGTKVEERDVRFSISLYNLANIAPRQTNLLRLAVPDVEAAYRAILATAGPAKQATTSPAAGRSMNRVISSTLSGQRPEQMTGDLRIDVRTAEAADLLRLVRGQGEMITASVSENADTANTTAAKTGIQVHLVNVASVPARETATLRVAAVNVAETYNKLVTTVQGMNQAAAQVLSSQLSESNPQEVRGMIQLEVRRADQAMIENLLAAGNVAVVARQVSRSTNATETLDTKYRYAIDLMSAAALPPRRTATIGVDIRNVEKALGQIRSQTAELGGREIAYTLSKTPDGRTMGKLSVEVPVAQAGEMLSRIGTLGGEQRTFDLSETQRTSAGTLARDRFDITFAEQAPLVAADKGLGATFHSALSAALGALLWSLYVIVMGVVFVGPFALLLWAVTLPWRRRHAAKKA